MGGDIGAWWDVTVVIGKRHAEYVHEPGLHPQHYQK